MLMHRLLGETVEAKVYLKRGLEILLLQALSTLFIVCKAKKMMQKTTISGP